MATNKVVYGNSTLIDLTSDTATESDVASGKTFHKADGSSATGTATGGGTEITPSNSSPVLLTKDNSYTIKDNNGYAIQSYYNINSVSPSYPQVLRGGNVYKLSNNIILGFLLSNRYFREGCMSFITKIDTKLITPPADGEEKDFIYTAGRMIKLRFPEGANTLQLVSILDDESESAITLATVPAAYHDTFKVGKIHFLNLNQFLIIYYWNTSATVTGKSYIKLIRISETGALTQSSIITFGSYTTSATIDVENTIIPLLYDNTSFLCIHKETTISTGAVLLQYRILYANLSTGSLTADGDAWSSLVGSDVDTFLPPMDISISRGGVFFKNASGVDRLLLQSSYNSTIKNLVVSESISDRPDLLVNSDDIYVYILGFDSKGYLITARIDVNSKEIDIIGWIFNPVTCYFKYSHEFTIFGSNNVPNILYYKNGILITTEYSRNYIYEGSYYAKMDIDGSVSITVTFTNELGDTYIDTSDAGPISDLFNCAFIT